MDLGHVAPENYKTLDLEKNMILEVHYSGKSLLNMTEFLI